MMALYGRNSWSQLLTLTLESFSRGYESFCQTLCIVTCRENCRRDTELLPRVGGWLDSVSNMPKRQMSG